MVGRHLPTAKIPNPPLYRMNVFAPDEVTAKSRFWYFMAQLKKVKKSNGEVISISEVRSLFKEIIHKFFSVSSEV